MNSKIRRKLRSLSHTNAAMLNWHIQPNNKPIRRTVAVQWNAKNQLQ